MNMRLGVLLISAFLLFSLIGVVSVNAYTCADADVNKDSVVNAFDLLSVRQCLNQTSAGNCSIADMDKNGIAEEADADIVRQFYLQNCSTQTCSDSDGGINYYVKGTTSFGKYNYTDSCPTGYSLVNSGQSNEYTLEAGDIVEYSCYDEDGQSRCSESSCRFIEYHCPYGCRDGACLKEEELATEGYAYAYWECKDGKTSNNAKDSTTCHTEVEWLNKAKEFCNGELATFSTAQKCKMNSEKVTEKITCKFENTKTEQKCYLAGEFNDADLGTKYCIAAAGSGSCVIAYTGYKGEQVGWKSSCGNIAATTQDGNDEIIYFKCESGETDITKIKSKGFTNVYFQCYDGAESKSTSATTSTSTTSPSIDRVACKSADYWKKFASNFCAAHCNKKSGKCGVNSFSIGNECYLGEGLCKDSESTSECCSRWAKENSIAIPTCAGGWTIDNDKCSWSCKVEEQQCKIDSDCPQPNCGDNTNCVGVSIKCSEAKCVYGSTIEPVLVCKDSCPLDGKCYDFGYRKSGKYCSDEGGFVEQKKSESCDNNFECSSNVCVNNQCISEGFLQKIMNWFRKMFGGK